MAESDLNAVIAGNNLDADRRVLRRNERMDEIWEEHNSKVNTIIGKLTAALVYQGRRLCRLCAKRRITAHRERRRANAA